MIVCSIDLGFGFYRSMQVQNAAQAGAAYAITHGFDATAIGTAISSATTFSSIQASPQPIRFCGCAASSGITTATCGSPCADGSQAGTYITVSAQAAYTTILAYPMLPDSYTLASQSTVRIQ